MRNGNVVFDLVVHVHNLLNSNFAEPAGSVAQPFKYEHLKILKEEVEELPPADEFFQIPPDPEGVVDKIFGGGSQIDFAMAQVVPLFDLFVEDPEDNIRRVHQMTQVRPDSIVFAGGTDPVLRTVPGALRDITWQIEDLGARSIKLYTAHAYGNSWRMDDADVCYPMLQRMLELDCNLVQVHKGDPQGLEPLLDLMPDDVHRAALDFPEMNFIVHHLAFPFDDIAIDLASRLPNVYLAMSTWINMVKTAPVETAMRLGKALRWCTPEKIIWGSETPLWPSAQHLLDLSWDFQIPTDLQAGWGFPEITEEDRSLMFGGNLLRLLGLPDDPDRIRTEIGGSQRRGALQ
ncbi:amidohydrolase family protein [Jiangella muralis]|uniref:amidohydrolase family protein n=1 Tax=Jiangella muralis TaxID=702383 RepID=UPI00069DC34E|nr:amidohydrolase family protein [Jiangella muralis]